MFKIRNFEDAQSYIRKILTSSIIFCIASLFLPESWVLIRFTLVSSAIVFFAATVYVIIRFCHCPKCGKMIVLGVLKVKNCPKCHRNLISGKKR